ncbi:MAG: hypothetical protein QW228_00920 [Candidatus Aenigmatarchaeota archaeon]
MKLVNLTPHPIVVKIGSSQIVIPPSGKIARVKVDQQIVGEIDGIPLVKNIYGDIEGLPSPEDGVIYIVSTLVLNAVKDRDDVVAPDTSTGVIRDNHGNIIAITRFVVK